MEEWRNGVYSRFSAHSGNHYRACNSVCSISVEAERPAEYSMRRTTTFHRAFSAECSKLLSKGFTHGRALGSNEPNGIWTDSTADDATRLRTREKRCQTTRTNDAERKGSSLCIFVCAIKKERRNTKQREARGEERRGEEEREKEKAKKMKQ